MSSSLQIESRQKSSQGKKIRIHKNQLLAANKILNYFYLGIGWNILLAQPQSGKTDTFYFVACEMIRKEIIKRVYIICGNSEIELKEQVKDADEFYEFKYKPYIIANLDYNEETSNILISKIKKMLRVWFGPELDKYNKEPFEIQDTLFIWEESHYAQDKINRPHKFLQSLHISADGNEINLSSKERNNFFLSVSATPFSELSNVVHGEQSKVVVKMLPGNKYQGVRKFRDRNQIIQFDCEDKKKLFSTLFDAVKMQSETETKKYAIIRIREDDKIDKMKVVKYITSHFNWNLVEYNSETKNKGIITINSLNQLKNAPDKNTLIVIKGMCRMGKQVPKDYISFVMETSVIPKTDVVLQGLLGRMFGYHDKTDIKVYISDKVDMDEIDRYIILMEDTTEAIPILPTNAKNIKSLHISRNNNIWHDNIPIKILTTFSLSREERQDQDYEEFKREKIIRFVQDKVRNSIDNIENYNPENQITEIIQQIQSMPIRSSEDFKVIVHEIVNSRDIVHKCFEKVPHRIKQSLQEKKVVKLGSSAGCGFESVEKPQINIWHFNTKKFEELGFPKDSLVIQTRTYAPDLNIEIKEKLLSKIPNTTLKETFCCKLEEGNIVTNNGSVKIGAPVESSTNIELMKKYLIDIISLSLCAEYESIIPREFTSTLNDDGKWKGIIVNEYVFAALQPKGEIYEEINKKWGISLKCTRSRGRQVEELKELGLQRLSKIEW